METTRPRTLTRLGAVAAIGGFAAIVVLWAPGDLGDADLPPELADEPDAYLEDGVITQFRDDGSLHYRLRADRIAHFERDGLSRLTAPAFDLHRDGKSPWHLESLAGEVRTVSTGSGESEEQVKLTGEVELTQNREDDRYTRVHAQSLILIPSREYVHSNRPVMIETEAILARAASFEADLATGRMKLHSSTDQRVSIVVEPDKHNADTP